MIPREIESGDRKLRIYSDSGVLHLAVAEFIVDSLKAALSMRPFASLVLTGGNTPRLTYQLLAARSSRLSLDWARVHFFWGDERCVPLDHPDSNGAMALGSLLNPLGIPPTNIHRMKGELEDHEAAARDYEGEIRRAFPGERLPAFDLVLLGMGTDGHTASLFPGTQWDEERLVVPNHVPKLDSWRLTMTPLLLNAARSTVFLVEGAAKAAAVAAVIDGPYGRYPAQRIRPTPGTLIWLMDEAAADKLTTK